MPRLFTGLEIPAELREEIARLKVPLPGGRWTEPDNLHLTLRFVGDIDKPQAAEFAERLAAIEIDAFELRLARPRHFRRQRAALDLGRCRRLARARGPGARQRPCRARSPGCRPTDARSSRTSRIARIKYASPDEIARVLQRIGAFRSRPYFVSRFVLFSAKPKTGGGPYAVEETFPLRGGEFADYQDIDGHW